ncbi:MAG: hypothetical protein WDN75_00780 [Bacteroidota bacterium]
MHRFERLSFQISHENRIDSLANSLNLWPHMTAIVGVLNSQGIAIAADSAVTVTGNKVKKVYNRSNKIFTLSKYHPVGIAVYGSADFMGIPIET